MDRLDAAHLGALVLEIQNAEAKHGIENGDHSPEGWGEVSRSSSSTTDSRAPSGARNGSPRRCGRS